MNFRSFLFFLVTIFCASPQVFSAAAAAVEGPVVAAPVKVGPVRIDDTLCGVPYSITLFNMKRYFDRLVNKKDQFVGPAERGRPADTILFLGKDKKISYSAAHAGAIMAGMAHPPHDRISLPFAFASRFGKEHLKLKPFKGEHDTYGYLMPRIEDVPGGIGASRLNLCDLFSRQVDACLLSHGIAEETAYSEREDRAGRLAEDAGQVQVSILGLIEMTLNGEQFVSYGLFQYVIRRGLLYHRAFKPFSYDNMFRLTFGTGYQALTKMLSIFFLENIFKTKESYTDVENAIYECMSQEELLAKNTDYFPHLLTPQVRLFFGV